MVSGIDVTPPLAGWYVIDRTHPRTTPCRHRTVSIQVPNGAEGSYSIVFMLLIRDHNPNVESGHVGVIIRHIFPRVANYLVLLAPPAMTYAIVLESVMSWLGIGLPRPTPSWGLMAADGRDLLPSAWWVSAFPALVILLVVLSLALLARRLKDQVVPRLKE